MAYVSPFAERAGGFRADRSETGDEVAGNPEALSTYSLDWQTPGDAAESGDTGGMFATHQTYPPLAKCGSDHVG